MKSFSKKFSQREKRHPWVPLFVLFFSAFGLFSRLDERLHAVGDAADVAVTDFFLML